MILSFQEKVYKIVKNIPEGKIMTYKQVAKLAGKPKAYRVVGNVLNKNYDSEIPCHRVVRSDGKIGGYNRGTKKKITLLKKEGVLIRGCSIVR
jgi:O-6-methylguanine DNA methyltransferase